MIEKVGTHGGTTVAKGLVGYGTARALARHCHGKKDAKVPLAIAAAGKLVPALAALFFGEVEGLGGVALGAFDAAGQGALDFIGVLHGLRDARKAKGVRPILVPANADVKALPPGAIADADLVGRDDQVTIGCLGVAQPGATMTIDKLRELQAYR